MNEGIWLSVILFALVVPRLVMARTTSAASLSRSNSNSNNNKQEAARETTVATTTTSCSSSANNDDDDDDGKRPYDKENDRNGMKTYSKCVKDPAPTTTAKASDDAEEAVNYLTSTKKTTGNNWRCACEGGFLPPGMLQSLGGGAEAVLRMSAGQCYHTTKKNA